jgi:hypothetical protein
MLPECFISGFQNEARLFVLTLCNLIVTFGNKTELKRGKEQSSLNIIIMNYKWSFSYFLNNVLVWRVPLFEAQALGLNELSSKD